jgi:CRISP-associated protein Cas1
MAWRGLHITKPGRLSLADGQIVVCQDNGDVRVPLEDIGWIILDEPRLTLTTALLSACAENGVALINTDARHMPSSLTLPFHQHHRQAAIAGQQINLTTPFRKRCWQAIVIAKIRNQADVLDRHGCAHGDTLRAMTKHVGSGDPDNIEARAARQYWSTLFSGFIRDDPSDLRNKMLNYGYAVMRAVVARALVGAGLLPCIGLHHASQTNPFNLADDLIEPFRPFVDHLVFSYGVARDASDDMTVDDRRKLAGVPLETARIDGGESSLLAATEACIASLVKAMELQEPSVLTLPSVLALPSSLTLPSFKLSKTTA